MELVVQVSRHPEGQLHQCRDFITSDACQHGILDVRQHGVACPRTVTSQKTAADGRAKQSRTTQSLLIPMNASRSEGKAFQKN